MDAFLAAVRRGDFTHLLQLLSPDVELSADAAAIAAGTPKRLVGQAQVAEFFNGAAKAALPAYVAGRAARSGFTAEARKWPSTAPSSEVWCAMVFRAGAGTLATVRLRPAGRVVGQHRATQRRELSASTPADPDAALRHWLREWAAGHPRRGFRNAHADACGEGWAVNHKKVQRLWREEGLRVPQRRRRKRTGVSTALHRKRTRRTGCGR